jgi:signal transduction histidine kinase
LIHDLRPIYLEDLGLATALEMLARETAQTLGIPVDFHLQGSEKRLSAQIEMVLFRMAQEAFRNIERHAQATQASLFVEFTDVMCTIEISDNGIGFEVPRQPSEFAPSGHYGLLGLYERADLIGAALEIQSSPGEGTFLRFRITFSSH